MALPEDPVLAKWASTLNDAGHWATVFDADWRFVFLTDELQSTFADVGAGTPEAPIVGAHLFSETARRYFGPLASPWFSDQRISQLGPYVLASTAGGREGLKRLVDPNVDPARIDELEPASAPTMWRQAVEWTTTGTDLTGTGVWIRIDDIDGSVAGYCSISKPAAGMSDLARAAATADLDHLARLSVLERPDRRPAAILMADLEASSPLSRRLSSAQYFSFNRRLVRAADQCTIDAGGIVGRHAGDGVVAFFLAEIAGAESAAARACIEAARSLREALPGVAQRSGIEQSDLSLRFGLHWGATLYIGRILTGGRSEVTALGDEANEAARIEACATGGRTLASKALIERLDPGDAAAIGIDTAHTTYTLLADLATATDKARRDAPSIAVCELSPAERRHT